MPLQKDTIPLVDTTTDEVLYNLPVPSYDYLQKVMTVARGEIPDAVAPINQQKLHSLKCAHTPCAAKCLPCFRRPKS